MATVRKWWTTTQAARAWKVSRQRVSVLLAQGRVKGARRAEALGHVGPWRIPAGAPKPEAWI